MIGSLFCCPNPIIYDRNSTTVSLREEMSDQESTLCLEIRKVSEDRDRCAKELAVQTSFLDEANIRIGR